MISPNFTVDDIIEVRHQLAEETAGMTIQEFLAYVHRGAVECKKLMEERRRRKEQENGEQNHPL